jgi:hypothetical protein
MDYRTLRRIERLSLFVLTVGCGYAGYQIYQDFSVGSLVMWGVLLVLYLAAFGWMLPDWSELEEIKDLYREVFDRIEAKKLTVYARELESARQKLFEARDRLMRSRAVLEGMPIPQVKQEMVEAWEALKTAPAEKKPALEQRFQELEHTYAMLSPTSKREEEFKDMKKNVLASLQHLRVRLAAQDADIVAEATNFDPSVVESFQTIHAIMDRVAKPTAHPAAQSPAQTSAPQSASSAPRSASPSASELPTENPVPELEQGRKTESACFPSGGPLERFSSPCLDEGVPSNGQPNPSSPPPSPVSRPERQ